MNEVLDDFSFDHSYFFIDGLTFFSVTPMLFSTFCLETKGGAPTFAKASAGAAHSLARHSLLPVHYSSGSVIEARYDKLLINLPALYCAWGKAWRNFKAQRRRNKALGRHV